jgi:predicted DNA binding protein
MLYSFVAPTFDAYQQILTTLESKGWQPKILEIGRFRSGGNVLTEKQERALLLALRLGFFEVPRRISMRELSNKLQVALSTSSEIIRRGLRRLLEQHFKT